MFVLGLNLILVKNLLISSCSQIMKASFLSILNIKYYCNHLLKEKTHHPSKFTYYLKSKHANSLGCNCGKKTELGPSQRIQSSAVSCSLLFFLEATAKAIKISLCSYCSSPLFHVDTRLCFVLSS